LAFKDCRVVTAWKSLPSRPAVPNGTWGSNTADEARNEPVLQGQIVGLPERQVQRRRRRMLMLMFQQTLNPRRPLEA
jgi:hypothetical protein